ncbi:sensor histidine kinase [Streptomyces sp. NBC_00239]|uniref:sensor histidine kinase n=1 Tax=Streptomyces sp. NBC_00239 TaxID=2903640 RepID=UPI002E29E412|nr:ATP-binding protein [Streptomyces sp. NBC_00239]
MNSATATVVASGFSEALNEGLLRAATRLHRPRTAAAAAARRAPALPGEREAAATGPVLWAWESEAILERFAERLPSVLLPAEAEAPGVRAALESFARTVLLRAGGAPDGAAADGAAADGAAPAPAAAPHQLVAAASLLFECGLLHVLEYGIAHNSTGLLRAVAVVQHLSEAMRGAGEGFWQGDGGRGDCRRLARQLHDELGGALATARRSVALAGADGVDGAARTAHLADARKALDEAAEENRALVDGLRRRSQLPPLGEALYAFLAGARPAAQVSVRIAGDERAAPERYRQEVFLVLREALRNCFAHSGAERVEVSVRTTRRWLYAKVEDDGAGLPDGGGTRGRGLQSMTDRIEDLGGRLRVSSGAGSGTCVEIHLPLGPRG